MCIIIQRVQPTFMPMPSATSLPDSVIFIWPEVLKISFIVASVGLETVFGTTVLFEYAYQEQLAFLLFDIS